MENRARFFSFIPLNALFMKKTLLLFTSAIALCSSAYAQPTLTATGLNPVAGDVFYGIQGDPGGTSAGSDGASVTWDYSFLTQTGKDTTTMLACASTPYCDSFPGSNIALFDNNQYEYASAGSSALSGIGVYQDGLAVRIEGNLDIVYYPLTYNSTHIDSYAVTVNYMGLYEHSSVKDSFVCDGYGTLMLPTGTYTNVLRLHQITVETDSLAYGGSSEVETYGTEGYDWYAGDFHHSLLHLDFDTSESATDPVDIEYYTLPTTGVASVTTEEALKVFPNPASDNINLSFSLQDTKDASVSISDVTGRVLFMKNEDALAIGQNNLSFSTAGFPAGVYMVQLQSAGTHITRKVVVQK